MNNEEREIGGYLDISANIRPRTDEESLTYSLNAARFCLEYLILTREYKSVWLPYYGCQTLARAVNRTNAKINYYTIDRDFNPIISDIYHKEPILYINYYGLMTKQCKKITEIYDTVIIDNAQAFYAAPIKDVDCIYSPRKFFALPDGGYIIPGKPLKYLDLETDISYRRIEHLFKRIDCGAYSAYSISVENRDSIANSSMKKMSGLTRLMLSQVDTEYASDKRKENYRVLHEELFAFNEFNIRTDYNDVPLFYPFLFKNSKLRQKLNDAKIFLPKYWPGMEEHTPPDSYDMYLQSYMHPLPIDQRYSTGDMYYISSVVKKFLEV